MPMQNMGEMIRLVNTLRTSKNPMQMLMNMAPQNNGISQALQMVNGKTPMQMQQIAMNLAQQRGVDINQLFQQLGLR